MIALLVISYPGLSQCGEWEKLFYYKNAYINDAAYDRFGNTYIVGDFVEDDFTLGEHMFSLPPGGSGIFIAKFDKNYSLVWAISPTVGRWARSEQIEIDKDDNLLFAGDFATSISFGCLSFHGTAVGNLFLVKLTADGIAHWLTGSSGGNGCEIDKITMSANGNCVLTARFGEKNLMSPNPPSVPDIMLGEVPVTTEAEDQINGGMDSFVASITSGGDVAWIQGIGGDGNRYEYATDLTTDSWNNVIVTGAFRSDKISFDGQALHRVGISENSYVAKINSVGQTLWVQGTEGANSQNGSGVDTDSEGNIFITGNYFFDAKFGSFILPAIGNDDVYIVKLTPNGTPVKATYIGGTGQEVATGLRVNDQDKVMVSAYYHSTYIEIGAFSSSKLPTDESDAFIATFSNDLATVECAEFITGSGAITIDHFKPDDFGNATLFFNFWVGYGLTINFNSQTFTDPDYFSVMAIMGNNPAPDEAEISDPFLLQSSLGKDTTLCKGEKLNLSVPEYCNAAYKWNTGSTDAAVEVSTPGLYWVDVTLNGITVRGDINVSYHEPIIVSLGNDRFVCPDEIITWVLPVYEEAVYQWSDGENANETSVTNPGTYWVEVSNRCEVVRQTVTLRNIAPPEVDLGNDISTCNREVTLQYLPATDETLLWSDGSTSPSLSVVQSGTYQLTVRNGCVETTDEIQVTIKSTEAWVIPNVVTHNNDGKNDHFLLPDNDEKYSLLIYNRWGKEIYSTNNYKNNWPNENLSTGVYFYTLKRQCMPSLSGAIHLLN